MRKRQTFNHQKGQLLVLILASLIPQFLGAQITIPASRFTNDVGQTIREVVYETDLGIDNQLATIIAATGPGQSWDFSNFNYIDSTVLIQEINLVDPADPNLNNPNLSGATHIWADVILPFSGGVQDSSFSFRYGRFLDGQWLVLGAFSVFDVDADGSRDTFFQWFSPPSLEIVFPVTANTSWFDSTSINQTFMGMTTTTAIIIDSNWVTGSGVLMTPRGSMEALRLRQKSINRIPNTPISDVGNGLEFQTLDGSISAAIVLEDGRAFHRIRTVLDGNPTSVRTVPQARFSLVGISPNPSKEEATVSFELIESSEVMLRLVDTRGTIINEFSNLRFPAGSHTHRLFLDEFQIPAGYYYLQMQVGQQVQIKPIVIAN